MKIKNKILVIENDPILAKNISSLIWQNGLVLTDCVPYPVNAIRSADLNPPDLVIVDAFISEQVSNFFVKFICKPTIIITDQIEEDILQFQSSMDIQVIVHKPVDFSELSVKTIAAIDKLNYPS